MSINQMPQDKLCTVCLVGGDSTPTAFILTCCQCKKHWHHPCHTPPISQKKLLMMIKETNKRAISNNNDSILYGIRAWQCGQCAKIRDSKMHSASVSSVPLNLPASSGLPAQKTGQSFGTSTTFSLPDEDSIIIIDKPVSRSTSSTSTLSTVPTSKLSTYSRVSSSSLANEVIDLTLSSDDESQTIQVEATTPTHLHASADLANIPEVSRDITESLASVPTLDGSSMQSKVEYRTPQPEKTQSNLAPVWMLNNRTKPNAKAILWQRYSERKRSQRGKGAHKHVIGKPLVQPDCFIFFSSEWLREKSDTG
ncbi:hypothetical protein BDQ12DRAFT_22182 [Crucibulum laeve]|uniref:Zinc finger PHD-type domain-containing protein n=1 Tax=Crucibulum laeve TaxID=68775 RepID=A0A5C3MIL8_9AGAR|nr:hypothetical protein BDQ12DRAFT_22182 [Crucibulum laeve]